MKRGKDEFEQYYSDRFSDRWPVLYDALRAPGTHAELSTGLARPYYLDPASIAVAELLPIADAQEIVDLCAAPGGKSLVLALRSAGITPGTTSTSSASSSRAPTSPAPRIVLNEKSDRRRARLNKVIAEHLPDSLRERVHIYGHDAARWGVHRPESAEAILADVPCSSEAHVIADEREFAKWSRSRIKRNVVLQHAILAAAIDTARPGGYILYSTCALTPEENDRVVEWAIKRRGDRIQPIADARATIEAAPISAQSTRILQQADVTEFGLHILPDVAEGAGPLYCALLRKR